LYESQIKWTHFSSDIVRVCKELINVLESNNVTSYAVKMDQNSQQGTIRNLGSIKEKIIKYD